MWYFTAGLYRFVLLIWLLLPAPAIGSFPARQNPQASDTIDYREVFGSSYNEAIAFIMQNTWIIDTLRASGVDPAMAIAVVFPELIRYSVLRDRMEINALKTLYVQYGTSYADFSVGRFQMKPSFIERLETDCIKSGICDRYYSGLDGIVNDNRSSRLERVMRLDDLQWQVKYLAMFMLVMDERYHHEVWISAKAKLRFYATAYNAGYWKSKEEINTSSSKRMFHTALITSLNKYSYAGVCLDFYGRFATSWQNK